MKKLLLTLIALISLSVSMLSAQTRWGVTGGVGFNQSKFSKIIKEKNPVGWNAGLTVSVDLPAGFTIQPTLQYHQKSVVVSSGITQSMSYAELPVSLQWGPDLLVFRPFLDCTPYIGYAISNRLNLGFSEQAISNWDGKQRFEFGLGLGGGIEVWRLQIVARYNWNFGSLYNLKGWTYLQELLKDLDAESPNFGGVTVGLSIFF